MRIVGLVLLGILGLVVLLLLIALVKTLLSPAKVSTYEPKADPARAQTYAEKLSKMIQCETVSYPNVDRRDQFLQFHQVLEELFPLVHQNLEKTELNGNLLFYWKGKSSEKPIVLMGHQDVVPAEGEWKYPPFSGTIADGKVWGRGANDTKCSVMAFFQACEELLQNGYVPEEDVYLVSSCTEEVGGSGGPTLCAEFKRRGVRPYLLCDEGGAITQDPMAGVKGKFAMIGVLEKGLGNVKFSAASNGGHSSYPPKHSPIARLSAFVNEIETKSPFKKEMRPEVQAMLEGFAPYAPFAMRYLFGNLWLFKPLLTLVIPSVSATAGAMLHTTMAFTMQSGSDGSNVMPQKATLTANLRYAPHQDMKDTLSMLEEKAKKHNLSMEVLDSSPSCPPVNIHGPQYKALTKAIEKVFPGLPYTPYVMTGATDARFYQDICDCGFRFSPLVYGPEQLKSMHGLNETITVDCLPGAVDFYKELIQICGD